MGRQIITSYLSSKQQLKANYGTITIVLIFITKLDQYQTNIFRPKKV